MRPLRINIALCVVTFGLTLLLGCVQPHQTARQIPLGLNISSNDSADAALHWEQGTGSTNDPPSDCASAPRAVEGSKSEGAIQGDLPPTAAYPIENVRVSKQDEISAKDLASFEGPVYSTILPAGYTLYRVIGLKSSAVSSWWTWYSPPPSKAEWRSRLAVPAQWNGASCLVKYKVGARGIKVWIGQASPQPDGAAGWYLKGGGWQVYVPKPSNQITRNALSYARIPWTQNN
jgi:hypothetical protein